MARSKFLNLFVDAVKKANSRMTENEKFKGSIYFQEIAEMIIQNYSTRKNKILLLIFFIILFIMYVAPIFINKDISLLLNIISITIFFYIVIPAYYFYKLLSSTEITTFEYIRLQLLYMLIPILATIQYFIFDNYYIVMSSLIISFFSATMFIYDFLIRLGVSKMKIRYLKYYNIVFSSILTMALNILIIFVSVFNVRLLMFIIAPLIILHLVYEKALLDIEYKESKMNLTKEDNQSKG